MAIDHVFESVIAERASKLRFLEKETERAIERSDAPAFRERFEEWWSIFEFSWHKLQSVNLEISRQIILESQQEARDEQIIESNFNALEINERNARNAVKIDLPSDFASALDSIGSSLQVVEHAVDKSASDSQLTNAHKELQNKINAQFRELIGLGNSMTKLLMHKGKGFVESEHMKRMQTWGNTTRNMSVQRVK